MFDAKWVQENASALLIIGGVLFLASWLWEAMDRPFARKAVTPIMLDGAVRYVATKSAWGLSQDHADPYFSTNVQAAITNALVSGDLKARGHYFDRMRGGVQTPPIHPRLPIPASFWATARWMAWWAINDPRPQNKAEIGDHEGQHDIRVDLERVKALWPKPKRSFRNLIGGG